MTAGDGPRNTPLVFKIEDADAWRAAEAAGAYHGAALDHRDGFIHLSAGDQVRSTLQAHFAGRRNLVLIALDTARLGDGLKWERSRGGAPFPHLYGALPMTAVVGVQAIGDDGSLPPLPTWCISE